ncbi:MAG: hypothetical protein WAW37_01735 [Syntrophobacteraceae bacterium]
MKLDLKGYRGNVSKTSTVQCNDPRAYRTSLILTGKVRALIDIRPKDMVSFRGMADQLGESIIELVGESRPFHFTGIENSLEGKVAHKLETIEDGKHYRLRVTNLLRQGSYAGYMILHTELAQKSEIKIRVNGIIEGLISVNPRTLLVGRLASQKPVRSGKVMVVSNSNKPFKITKLIHDANVVSVTQEPLPDRIGFSLEITPQMENVPPGSRRQSLVGIETDEASEEKLEVQVQVFNAVGAP